MENEMFSQDEAKSSEIRLRWSEEKFDKYGPKVLDRLDAIYDWAERNYKFGQWILETHTTDEILYKFDTIGEVRKYCRLIAEQELNHQF